MEPRELLSVTPMLVDQAPVVTPGDLVTAASLAQASTSSSSQGLNPAGSSSPLIGSDPTPRELARERFHAVFSGPVIAGPGRFADQAKTLYFQGLGGSNMFLHGDFQMAIVYPTDTSQPLFGEAYLQDKNNNSGGQIAFQIQGGTPQAVDGQGRPTELTFVNDPNIYSGIFYSNTSAGTVSIRYGKGTATVVFNGLVYTTGLTSPLKNGGLYATGGKVVA